MKSFVKNFLLIVLLLLPLSFSLQAGSITEWMNSYLKVFKKNTEEGSKHNVGEFKVKFRWHATHLSEDFLLAQGIKHRQDYPNSSNPFVEGLKLDLRNPPTQVAFVIGLYAKEKKLRRLSVEENFWELSLIQNNKVYLPTYLEKLPDNPYFKDFFPYLNNKWYGAYMVVFAEVQEPFAPFTLQLSSVAGKSKLKFK